MSGAALQTKIKETFGYKRYVSPDPVSLKFKFDLIRKEAERNKIVESVLDTGPHIPVKKPKSSDSLKAKDSAGEVDRGRTKSCSNTAWPPKKIVSAWEVDRWNQFHETGKAEKDVMSWQSGRPSLVSCHMEEHLPCPDLRKRAWSETKRREMQEKISKENLVISNLLARSTSSVSKADHDEHAKRHAWVQKAMVRYDDSWKRPQEMEGAKIQVKTKTNELYSSIVSAKKERILSGAEEDGLGSSVAKLALLRHKTEVVTSPLARRRPASPEPSLHGWSLTPTPKASLTNDRNTLSERPQSSPCLLSAALEVEPQQKASSFSWQGARGESEMSACYERRRRPWKRMHSLRGVHELSDMYLNTRLPLRCNVRRIRHRKRTVLCFTRDESTSSRGSQGSAEQGSSSDVTLPSVDEDVDEWEYIPRRGRFYDAKKEMTELLKMQEDFYAAKKARCSLLPAEPEKETTSEEEVVKKSPVKKASSVEETETPPRAVKRLMLFNFEEESDENASTATSTGETTSETAEPDSASTRATIPMHPEDAATLEKYDETEGRPWLRDVPRKLFLPTPKRIGTLTFVGRRHGALLKEKPSEETQGGQTEVSTEPKVKEAPPVQKLKVPPKPTVSFVMEARRKREAGRKVSIAKVRKMLLRADEREKEVAKARKAAAAAAISAAVSAAIPATKKSPKKGSISRCVYNRKELEYYTLPDVQDSSSEQSWHYDSNEDSESRSYSTSVTTSIIPHSPDHPGPVRVSDIRTQADWQQRLQAEIDAYSSDSVVSPSEGEESDHAVSRNEAPNLSRSEGRDQEATASWSQSQDAVSASPKSTHSGSLTVSRSATSSSMQYSKSASVALSPLASRSVSSRPSRLSTRTSQRESRVSSSRVSRSGSTFVEGQESPRASGVPSPKESYSSSFLSSPRPDRTSSPVDGHRSASETRSRQDSRLEESLRSRDSSRHGSRSLSARASSRSHERESYSRKSSVVSSRLDSREASFHDSQEVSVHDSREASVHDSREASVHDSQEASFHDSQEASFHYSQEASFQDSQEASVQDSREASVQDSRSASGAWSQQESQSASTSPGKVPAEVQSQSDSSRRSSPCASGRINPIPTQSSSLSAAYYQKEAEFTSPSLPATTPADDKFIEGAHTVASIILSQTDSCSRTPYSSRSHSRTPRASRSRSRTPRASRSHSHTPRASRSRSRSRTPRASRSRSRSRTPRASRSRSRTPRASRSHSRTPRASRSRSRSHSRTQRVSRSASLNASPTVSRHESRDGAVSSQSTAGAMSLGSESCIAESSDSGTSRGPARQTSRRRNRRRRGRGFRHVASPSAEEYKLSTLISGNSAVDEAKTIVDETQMHDVTAQSRSETMPSSTSRVSPGAAAVDTNEPQLSPHSPDPSLDSPRESQGSSMEAGDEGERSAGLQSDAGSATDQEARTRSDSQADDALSRGEGETVVRSTADSIMGVVSGGEGEVLVKSEPGEEDNVPGAYFRIIGSGELGTQRSPRVEVPDMRAEGVPDDSHHMDIDFSVSDTLKQELSFKSMASDTPHPGEDSDTAATEGQEKHTLNEESGNEQEEDESADQRDASTYEDGGEVESQGTEQSEVVESTHSAAGSSEASPEGRRSIRSGHTKSPPAWASEGADEYEDSQTQDTEAGLESEVVFVQKIPSQEEEAEEEETTSRVKTELYDSYQEKDEGSAPERMESAVSVSLKTPLSSASDGDEDNTEDNSEDNTENNTEENTEDNTEDKDTQPSLTSFHSCYEDGEEEEEQEYSSQNKEPTSSLGSAKDDSDQSPQESETERPEISSWVEGGSQAEPIEETSADDNDNAADPDNSNVNHTAELNSNASSNNSALGDMAHLYQKVSNPQVESVFPVHPPEHLQVHSGRSHGVSPLTKDTTTMASSHSDLQAQSSDIRPAHRSLHLTLPGCRRQSPRVPKPQEAKAAERQADRVTVGTVTEGRLNRANRNLEHHRPNSARISHYKTSKTKGSLTPLERCLSSPTASKRTSTSTLWQQNEHACLAPSSEGSLKSRSASLKNISSSHETATSMPEGQESSVERHQLACPDVSPMEGQSDLARSSLASDGVEAPQFAKKLLGKQEKSHDKLVTSSSMSSRTSSKSGGLRRSSKPSATEGPQVSPMEQKLKKGMKERVPVGQRHTKGTLQRHQSSPVGSAKPSRDNLKSSVKAKRQTSGRASSPVLPTTAAATRGTRNISGRRVLPGASSKNEKGKPAVSTNVLTTGSKRTPGARSSKEKVQPRESKSIASRRKPKTAKAPTSEQTAKKAQDSETGPGVESGQEEPCSKASKGDETYDESKDALAGADVQTCVNSLRLSLDDDQGPQGTSLRPCTPESFHLYSHMSEDSDFGNPASPCLSNSGGGPLSPGALHEGIRGRAISPTAVASAGHGKPSLLSCGTSPRSCVSSSQEDLLALSLGTDINESSMATPHSGVDTAPSTGRSSNKNSPRSLGLHVPRPPSGRREGQPRFPHSAVKSARERQSRSPLAVSPRHPMSAGPTPRSLQEIPRPRVQKQYVQSPLCDTGSGDRTSRSEGTRSAKRMKQDERKMLTQRGRGAFQGEASKYPKADHPSGKKGYSPVVRIERSPEKICTSPVKSSKASPVRVQGNVEALPQDQEFPSRSSGFRICLDLNTCKETTSKHSPRITIAPECVVSSAVESSVTPSPCKKHSVVVKKDDEVNALKKETCHTKHDHSDSLSSKSSESKSSMLGRPEEDWKTSKTASEYGPGDSRSRKLVSPAPLPPEGQRRSTSHMNGGDTSEVTVSDSIASCTGDSRHTHRADKTSHGSPVPAICVTPALTSDEGSGKSKRSELRSLESILGSSVGKNSDYDDDDQYSPRPRVAHSRKSTNLSIQQEHAQSMERTSQYQGEVQDKSRPQSACSRSYSSASSKGDREVCFVSSPALEVTHHDPTSRNNSHPQAESNRDFDTMSPELSSRNEKLIRKEYIGDRCDEYDDSFYTSDWVHCNRAGIGEDYPQSDADLMHGISGESHHEDNSSVGFGPEGSHRQNAISSTSDKPEDPRKRIKSPPSLYGRPHLVQEAPCISENFNGHFLVEEMEALTETISFQTKAESSAMESTNKNASPALAERSNTPPSPRAETATVETTNSTGWGHVLEMNRNDLTEERDVYSTGPPGGVAVITSDFGTGTESHASSGPSSPLRAQCRDSSTRHDREKEVHVDELSDKGSASGNPRADPNMSVVATQCETTLPPTADTGTCIDKDFLSKCLTVHSARPKLLHPFSCRGKRHEKIFDTSDETTSKFRRSLDVSDAETQCEKNTTPRSDAATGIEADFYPQCRSPLSARLCDPYRVSPVKCSPRSLDSPRVRHTCRGDSKPLDARHKEKGDFSWSESPDAGSSTASAPGHKKKPCSAGHYSAKRRIQCIEGQIEQRKQTITLQREVLTRPKSDTSRFPEVLTPLVKSEHESTSLSVSKKDVKSETLESERQTDRKEETITMSSDTVRRRERKKKKDRRSEEKVVVPCRETSHTTQSESDTTASSDNLRSRELKAETPKYAPVRSAATEQIVNEVPLTPACRPEQTDSPEVLENDRKCSKQKKRERKPVLQRPPPEQTEESSDKDGCLGNKPAPSLPTADIKRRQQKLPMTRLEVPSILAVKPPTRKNQSMKHAKNRRLEPRTPNKTENDRKALSDELPLVKEDATASTTSQEKSAASANTKRGGNSELAPARSPDGELMSPLDAAKAQEELRAQMAKFAPPPPPPAPKRRRHEAGTKQDKNAAKQKRDDDDDDDDTTISESLEDSLWEEKVKVKEADKDEAGQVAPEETPKAVDPSILVPYVVIEDADKVGESSSSDQSLCSDVKGLSSSSSLESLESDTSLEAVKSRCDPLKKNTGGWRPPAGVSRPAPRPDSGTPRTGLGMKSAPPASPRRPTPPKSSPPSDDGGPYEDSSSSDGAIAEELGPCGSGSSLSRAVRQNVWSSRTSNLSDGIFNCVDSEEHLCQSGDSSFRRPGASREETTPSGQSPREHDRVSPNRTGPPEMIMEESVSDDALSQCLCPDESNLVPPVNQDNEAIAVPVFGCLPETSAAAAEGNTVQMITPSACPPDCLIAQSPEKASPRSSGEAPTSSCMRKTRQESTDKCDIIDPSRRKTNRSPPRVTFSCDKTIEENMPDGQAEALTRKTEQSKKKPLRDSKGHEGELTGASSKMETPEILSLPELSHSKERQVTASPSQGFHPSFIADLQSQDSEEETGSFSLTRCHAEHPVEIAHGRFVLPERKQRHRSKAKLKPVLTTRTNDLEEKPTVQKTSGSSGGVDTVIDPDSVEDAVPEEEKEASQRTSTRQNESDRSSNASPVCTASHHSDPLPSASLTGSEAGSAKLQSLKEDSSDSSPAVSPRQRQRRKKRDTLSPERTPAELVVDTEAASPEKQDFLDDDSRHGPKCSPKPARRSMELGVTKTMVVDRPRATPETPLLPPDFSIDDKDASSRGPGSKTESHTSVTSGEATNSSAEAGSEDDATCVQSTCFSLPKQSEEKANLGEDCRRRKSTRHESASERSEASTASRRSHRQRGNREEATADSMEEAQVECAGLRENQDKTDITDVDPARKDISATDPCTENVSYDYDNYSQCSDFVPCSDTVFSKQSITAQDVTCNEPSEPDVTQQVCQKSESEDSSLESLTEPVKSSKHSVGDESSVQEEEVEAEEAKSSSEAFITLNCGLWMQLTASPRSAATFEHEEVEAVSCVELGTPASEALSSQSAGTGSAAHKSGEASHSEDEADQEIENIFTAGFLKLASNQTARPPTPVAGSSSGSNNATSSKSSCSNKSSSSGRCNSKRQ